MSGVALSTSRVLPYLNLVTSLSGRFCYCYFVGKEPRHRKKLNNALEVTLLLAAESMSYLLYQTLSGKLEDFDMEWLWGLVLLWEHESVQMYLQVLYSVASYTEDTSVSTS